MTRLLLLVLKRFPPSHQELTPLLAFIVSFSSTPEVWKLPKTCSVEQQQRLKIGRRGGRQRGGGKCQGSFANQIEYYPFVSDAMKTFYLLCDTSLGGLAHTKSFPPPPLDCFTVLSADLLNFALTCVKEVDFVCSAT